MEAEARQFVSCVAEAASAIKTANVEVLSSQVAESIVGASNRTLETLHLLSVNHAQVISSLQDRINTYETTIKSLVSDSASNVEIALSEASSAGPDVASVVRSLLQVALNGKAENNNNEQPETSLSEEIFSISDWFKKVTTDSQKTITDLSAALGTVTAEREQLRAELALLKANTVPTADLQQARQYIAKLEGDLTSAASSAREMQEALTIEVTKALSAHASEKAVLNGEIAALNASIATLTAELETLRNASSTVWERDSAAIHRQTLAEALAEAETAALAAAEARQQLGNLPRIEQQLEASKQQNEQLHHTTKEQSHYIEALKKDLNTILHQNAVLTAQLAEALSTNTRMVAEQSAKAATGAAKLFMANNRSSTTTTTTTTTSAQSLGHKSRQWLFLSGAQNGNVTTVANAGGGPNDNTTREIIGQKTARTSSAFTYSAKSFPRINISNSPQNPTELGHHQLSSESAAYASKAVQRYLSNNGSSKKGAAIGISDHSSDDDDTNGTKDNFEALAHQSCADYGVDNVVSLIQQNSLLVCLLFEQRQQWQQISNEMKDLAKADSKSFTATFGISQQSDDTSSLKTWARKCLEESLLEGKGPSKRLRSEKSKTLSEIDLSTFEDSLLGTTTALLASLREQQHQQRFIVEDDAEESVLPDVDDVIYGDRNTTTITALALPKLESYAAIKAELWKLLNAGDGEGAAHYRDTDSDGYQSDDDEGAVYSELLDDHKLLKGGKIYISEGTSPDYTLLATEGLKNNKVETQNVSAPKSVDNVTHTNAITTVCEDLKRRANIIAAASVAAITTWAGMFATHALKGNTATNTPTYRSVTDITLQCLRSSLAAYSNICTEQDCELIVLRSRLEAATAELQALQGHLAVSTSNDTTNFNALQMLADYLGQCFTQIGNPNNATPTALANTNNNNVNNGFGARPASSSASSSPLATNPTDIQTITIFSNVLEALNATANREETLADIFVRASAAFASNPEVAERLRELRRHSIGGDHPQEDISHHLSQQQQQSQLVRNANYDTYTFGNWRAFTSSNVAMGVTNPAVEAELRAALESEAERANYFQGKFEASAAQQEQWMEQLFTTDQKCEDLEALLSEAKSTMVTKDEHTRILLEFESTLARKREVDERVASLQTSLNSRDADITKLVIKCQELEDQLMKNDSDHRAYEQSIQSQVQALQWQVQEREGVNSQLRSLIAQSETQTNTLKQRVANREDKIAKLEAIIQKHHHETITEAYRTGILAEMFPGAEEALTIALEAAENKRVEATHSLSEIAALQSHLARTEQQLQRSEAALMTESAQRQRLQLLLSDSEATVRSYYENVEEAMSSLKVRCEALERQLASVTRERDATVLRENALKDQVDVLSSDPITANVRRYGLAATRLFESQMSELNDILLSTKQELAETQNDLSDTKADRDRNVASLTAQKSAVEDALAAQQRIVTELAEEREKLRSEQNTLQNQHRQLQFTCTNQEATIRDLTNEKSALDKRTMESEAMVNSLKADIESFLVLTKELREANEKLQASEAAAKRLNDELKRGHDRMKMQMQEAATAASASRARPQHRQLQIRPPQ